MDAMLCHQDRAAIPVAGAVGCWGLTDVPFPGNCFPWKGTVSPKVLPLASRQHASRQVDGTTLLANSLAELRSLLCGRAVQSSWCSVLLSSLCRGWSHGHSPHNLPMHGYPPQNLSKELNLRLLCREELHCPEPTYQLDSSLSLRLTQHKTKFSNA